MQQKRCSIKNLTETIQQKRGNRKNVEDKCRRIDKQKRFPTKVGAEYMY
jgi:hypothetical protein